MLRNFHCWYELCTLQRKLSSAIFNARLKLTFINTVAVAQLEVSVMTLEKEMSKGKNNGRIYSFMFIIFLLFILITSKGIFARDVSFTWNASGDDPKVDGYLLYYKTGYPGENLNDYLGTDASGNNSSPVKITGSSATSYTLPNLVDSERYSFVMASYRGSDKSGSSVAVTLEPADINAPPAPTIITIQEIK